MEENKGCSISIGGGFSTLLQIAFIVLKLCGVINWSWGLVLLPLWIGLGITVISLIILLIIVLVRR